MGEEQEVTIKKWGNSMGIVIPREVIERQHLKENEKVIVTIVKKADLSHLFGMLKGKVKMSGQEFKDLAREGWN